MALDKQISVYSVDTGHFYSKKEMYLHKLNHKIRAEKRYLLQKIKLIEDELIKYLDENNIESSISNDILKGKFDYSDFPVEIKHIDDLCKSYTYYMETITHKTKKSKETKEDLWRLLSNKVQANIDSDGAHHIRELKDSLITEKNKISIFDSSLTRMLGIKQDEFTDDIMVIQVYYFDIIKDLIYFGFTYKGEKYRYFTSSAGQIRTKKTVFIKESIWNKYEKTIMCGLTLNSINNKGGNNPNKHLAYLALNNSATDLWKDFDIDKSIVVDDFETNVFGTYDLIDDETYTIKRISGYVPIPHTDGAGMMLPCLGKNRMVRLPWIKGLLGVFDFNKFINKHNCNPVIKDIYGKEHNIIAEDIQIIFTKSQFKMYKYYDSWDEYKEYYKKYHCSAGYTNLEEDRIRNATINYQMLQTLTDATDEEIYAIADKSIQKLENLCSNVANMKKAFGITVYNQNQTSLQKSINLYPNLLNDEYLKTTLREIKNSLVKRYRSGKLEVRGKYTFILPDLYAFCEYLFKHEENPKGLLKDGEVFCWLFRKDSKVDCLRSPHLYKEHAIRNNIADKSYGERRDEIREWFTTDAVYTSCFDLISKILQFDRP